ncbi:MAG: hypothetical protein ACREEJ_07935 [Ensifer adhaerens]
MKSLAAIVAAGSAFFGGVAHADCSDILKYINYDTQRNYASLDSEQVNYATFCSERYESSTKGKGAAISASYSVWSGNLSATSTEIQKEQEKFCKGKYGKDYLSTLNIVTTDFVSQRAVDALQTCYASDNSWQLTSLSRANEGFSASFKWRGGAPITFTSVRVVPSATAVPCTVDYKDKTNIRRPFQVQANTNVQVTCKRAWTSEAVAPGETAQVLPDGLVTVVTESNAVSIPLVEVRQTLSPNSRLAALERADQAMSLQLADLTTTDANSTKRIQALEKRKWVLVSSLGSEWIEGNNRNADCGDNAALARLRITFHHSDSALRCRTFTVEPR